MSSVVERRVSVCGEGGGPSTVVARECCVWKLSAGYVAMCCAFPGSSIGFCTLGGNFL